MHGKHRTCLIWSISKKSNKRQIFFVYINDAYLHIHGVSANILKAQVMIAMYIVRTSSTKLG